MKIIIFSQSHRLNACVVCVLTGLWTGQYYRIMRWWSSSLGQWLLQSYTLSLIVEYFYPASPTTLVPTLATTRGHLPTRASPISVTVSPPTARGHPSIIVWIMYYLFLPRQQSAEIIHTYIRRNSVWTEIWYSQWYKRSRIWNIICMYLQQKICFMNSFCTYIAQNLLLQKKKEANRMQCSQNNYFSFNTSENIYIFMYCWAN